MNAMMALFSFKESRVNRLIKKSYAQQQTEPLVPLHQVTTSVCFTNTYHTVLGKIGSFRMPVRLCERSVGLSSTSRHHCDRMASTGK